MPEGVRGILVTHGDLGAELRRTAESILGPQDALFAVSNAGLSAEALAERVRLLLPPSGRVVLFVDLLAGSCGIAGAVLQRESSNLLLAGGVNLPMLLEFLVHRGRATPQELKERLRTKAGDAIRCVGWDTEAGA
jgi:mannose/fructose-specific phosphotransferase system component IIA